VIQLKGDNNYQEGKFDLEIRIPDHIVHPSEEPEADKEEFEDIKEDEEDEEE
jgi:hypothetical protein